MSAYGASFGLLEDLGRLVPESHRIVVPEQVLRELSAISKGTGRAAAAAKLALRLASRLDVVSVEGDRADDAILNLSSRIGGNVIVCTHDAELKNILKSRRIRVIGVRDFSHLDFL